jgi:hypothetical protein
VSGVKYSPALKWFIAILLPLSIAWKLAIKPDNPIATQAAIVDFLLNQQFDASVTSETMVFTPIIKATSDSCRLRLATISPLGYEANLIQSLGAMTDKTFFVFRGTIYSEQPIALTVVSYLWFKFLRELGLISRIPPVIGVSASCDARILPWEDLQRL